MPVECYLLKTLTITSLLHGSSYLSVLHFADLLMTQGSPISENKHVPYKIFPRPPSDLCHWYMYRLNFKV